MKNYKWKRALTAEQAALFVMGLDIDETLDEECKFARDHCSDADCSEEAFASKQRLNKLIEAQHIRDAILEDARHNISKDPAWGESKLIVTNISHIDLILGNSSRSEHSIFTKESLAHWFYKEGDTEKAKILIPNFTANYLNNAALLAELQKRNKKLIDENKLLIARLEEKIKGKGPFRESSKPYELIAQLIGIILPNANLEKTYQVYDEINHMLGQGNLVVSSATLKTYLEKSGLS